MKTAKPETEAAAADLINQYAIELPQKVAFGSVASEESWLKVWRAACQLVQLDPGDQPYNLPVLVVSGIGKTEAIAEVLNLIFGDAESSEFEADDEDDESDLERVIEQRVKAGYLWIDDCVGTWDLRALESASQRLLLILSVQDGCEDFVMGEGLQARSVCVRLNALGAERSGKSKLAKLAKLTLGLSPDGHKVDRKFESSEDLILAIRDEVFPTADPSSLQLLQPDPQPTAAGGEIDAAEVHLMFCPELTWKQIAKAPKGDWAALWRNLVTSAQPAAWARTVTLRTQRKASELLPDPESMKHPEGSATKL